MKSIAIGMHLRAEDVEPLARAVSASNLIVSAIDVDDDQPVSDRDLMLRVADIRAQLLERATFIAVRYGFTFRSASEAEGKIGSNAPRWRKLLEEPHAGRADAEGSRRVSAAEARSSRVQLRCGLHPRAARSEECRRCRRSVQARCR
jgi:hypothetical protein